MPDDDEGSLAGKLSMHGGVGGRDAAAMAARGWLEVRCFDGQGVMSMPEKMMACGICRRATTRLVWARFRPTTTVRAAVELQVGPTTRQAAVTIHMDARFRWCRDEILLVLMVIVSNEHAFR